VRLESVYRDWDAALHAKDVEAAIRLYRRHGYRPTWTYLSRFAGRRP